MNSFIIKLADKIFNTALKPICSAGKTDIGKTRTNNEDYFAIRDQCLLYIVADGMGGHKGGEVASRTATESILTFFSPLFCKKISSNPEEIRHALIGAFHHANDMVIEMSSTNDDLQGMGCTLVACLIDDDTLYTCHVGDARCYLANEQTITQITRDHTFTSDGKVASNGGGKKTKKQSNMLTRAIGFPFPEDPDYHSHKIESGNKIVLCSDGLWNMVENQIIYQVLRESITPEQACDKLVKMANNNGGRDNITAVVIYT